MMTRYQKSQLDTQGDQTQGNVEGVPSISISQIVRENTSLDSRQSSNLATATVASGAGSTSQVHAPTDTTVGTAPSLHKGKGEIPAISGVGSSSQLARAGTPQQMTWDNDGFNPSTPYLGLRDEMYSPSVSPSRVDSTLLPPSSRPASAASNFSDPITQEVDFQKVQSSLTLISSLLGDSSALSMAQLQGHYDVLIAIHTSLKAHQLKFPLSDTNVIIELLNQVSSLKLKINNLRFGPGVPPALDFRPASPKTSLGIHGDLSKQIDSKLSVIHEDLAQQIRDYLSTTEARTVLNATNNICDEYNRVQVKCVSTKNELKRSISGLRQDLATVLQENRKRDNSFTNMNSNVECAFTLISDSNERVNTRLQDLSNRITEVESKVTAVSDFNTRLSCLEKSIGECVRTPDFETLNQKVSNLGPSGQVTNGEQSPNDLRDQLLDLPPPIAASHPIPPRIRGNNLTSGVSAPVTGHIPPHVDQRVGDVSMASSSDQSKLARLQRKIYVCGDLITKITSKDIAGLSKPEVIQLVKYELKTLEGLKKDFKEYESQLDSIQSVPDEDLLDYTDSIIRSIAEWTDALNDLQKRYYLHLSGERSLLRNVELSKFDGSPDGDTVYQFLSTFTRLSELCCSPEEQATLLFNTYLADNIKKEVESFKASISCMTDWLIKRYGDLRAIADSKMRRIGELKKPPPAQTAAVIEYYKTVENLLLHIESLGSSDVVNTDEIRSIIYNAGYVKNVVSFLPKDFIHKFVGKIEREPQSPPPTGARYFQILKNLLNSHWRELGSFSDIIGIRDFPSDQRKSVTQKTTHIGRTRAASITARSLSPDRSSIKSVSPDRASIFSEQITANVSKSVLTHPCPMHDVVARHELGMCKTFFLKSNSQRFDICKSRLVCFTCFKKECLSASRTCISPVPEVLICQTCKSQNTQARRTPSVLTCLNPKHERPSVADLQSALLSYLKVLDPNLLEKFKDHFNLFVHAGQLRRTKPVSEKRPPSKSTPSDINMPVPAFDTVKGSSVGPDIDVKYPSSEAPIYIFQTLSLNGYHCTTFFDTGASGNLVRGKMAEAAGFKTIDPKTQLIGGVGNKSFYTDYGVYCARLGPDKDGSYHELLFQGIEQITSQYPRYDLSDINSEVSASGKLPPNSELPKAVGGSSVDIIIGISSPELVPKLLFWLPSGIGVYESALSDIDSSRITYGGTHKSITKFNKAFKNFKINHTTVMFQQLASSYMGAPWLDLEIMPPTRDLSLCERSRSSHTSIPLLTDEFIHCRPTTGVPVVMEPSSFDGRDSLINNTNNSKLVESKSMKVEECYISKPKLDFYSKLQNLGASLAAHYVAILSFIVLTLSVFLIPGIACPCLGNCSSSYCFSFISVKADNISDQLDYKPLLSQAPIIDPILTMLNDQPIAEGGGSFHKFIRGCWRVKCTCFFLQGFSGTRSVDVSQNYFLSNLVILLSYFSLIRCFLTYFWNHLRIILFLAFILKYTKTDKNLTQEIIAKAGTSKQLQAPQLHCLIPLVSAWSFRHIVPPDFYKEYNVALCQKQNFK